MHYTLVGRGPLTTGTFSEQTKKSGSPISSCNFNKRRLNRERAQAREVMKAEGNLCSCRKWLGEPEGGEESELINSWSTHTRGAETSFARTPWCPIKQQWDTSRLFFQPVSANSIQGINTPEFFTQLPPAARLSLSLYPLGYCALFFFSPPLLFSGGNSFPPFALVTERFPHLLPIIFGCSWSAASHLGQCGVSACSPLPRRHGGRDVGESEAKLIWVGILELFFFFPSVVWLCWRCNPQPGKSSLEGGALVKPGLLTLGAGLFF